MSSTKWIQEKPEECPVCYEEMASEKDSLECGHWVHVLCIQKSLKAQCPLCRHKLTNVSLFDRDDYDSLMERFTVNVLADYMTEEAETNRRNLLAEYRMTMGLADDAVVTKEEMFEYMAYLPTSNEQRRPVDLLCMSIYIDLWEELI